MKSDAHRSLSRGAIATALLLSAMWGLNIVGIKVALAAFPPIWNAFWRVLLGWPVLWLWARAGRIELMPGPGEIRPLAFLGAFFAIQIILLNTSIGWTSAAYASVLLNAAPVYINLIAHFIVPGDRLSGQRLIGLALAFCGIAVVMLGRPEASLAPRPVLGNVLAALTAVILACRMIYTKRLVQAIDSTKAMFWQVGFSIPIFLVCAALTEPMLVGPLTLGPILSWLYCSFGVVGVAFILWVRLLETNSPGLLSVFVFPTPIFGVLFSALIFAEKASWELVIGVMGVAFGILLVTLERRGSALPPTAKAAPEPGPQGLASVAAWKKALASRRSQESPTP